MGVILKEEYGNSIIEVKTEVLLQVGLLKENEESLDTLDEVVECVSTL